MEPLVSVILLIYMVEAYLPKCIESAMGQSYRNIEIILAVCEGKDRSLKICEEYEKKDSRIKLVKRDEKGRGAGRNSGMKAARGKYVLFIDGDDHLGPDMVLKLVDAAEKHGADAAVCGDVYEYENEPGRYEEHVACLPEVFGRRELYGEILSRRSFGLEVWNKLFLFEKVRDIEYGDEMAEDRFWSVKAFRRLDRIAYVPSPEFFYVVRGDSASRKPHIMESSMEADRMLCRDIEDIHSLKEESDNFLFISCYNALYEALHFGYFEFDGWKEVYLEMRSAAANVVKSAKCRKPDRIKAFAARLGFRPLILTIRLSMRFKPAGLYDDKEESSSL